MIYGSVCSGIEAATVAWEPLGWVPRWFAEVAEFPSAVLARRHPGVPNHGDFTGIGAEHGGIDLLVGGTPCQSWSTSGRRRGLDDPRGNLSLEFCRLADRLRPRWVLWENVRGVLSCDRGRAFGSFLGALGELGYGVAWRILDGRYFGVPQQRDRVYLVGYFGDWRRAAAIVLEPGGVPIPASMALYGDAPRAGGGDPRVGVPYRLTARRAGKPCWARRSEVAYCLTTSGSLDRNQGGTVVVDRGGIRDLTPEECERAMGFPAGYTAIGSGETDADRIHACGNSMIVDVMRWLGSRIEFVDGLPINPGSPSGSSLAAS